MTLEFTAKRTAQSGVLLCLLCAALPVEGLKRQDPSRHRLYPA